MLTDSECWGKEAFEGMCTWKYDGFTYQVYEESLRLKCMYNVLKQTAGRMPDAVALVDNWGHKCTYCQLLDKTDRFAEYLKDVKKVQKGDRIGMMLYNSIELCVMFMALSKLGAVCVSLPTKFRRTEVNALNNMADVSGIVCNEEYADWFPDVEEKGCFILAVGSGEKEYEYKKYEIEKEHYSECEGELSDTAIILFTSGTTSRSKGAELRNFNVLHAVIAYQRIFWMKPEDKTLTPTPIYHITGMIAIFSLFVYAGGCVYLFRRFEPGKIMDMVRKERITFIHSTPTVFIKLLEERLPGEKIDCITSLACGSSSMPIQKIKELHEWMPNMKFRTCYGLTETTSVGTTFPGDAAVSHYCGSSGRPAPGMEFEIWDDQNREVPAGQYGEVMIRGAAILCNYLNLKSDLIEDHWLHTGDIGYFNEDGFIWIVDRKKDMINYGGEKVPGYDIENAIYKIPEVKETAVFGVKDLVYGEIVGAAISLHEGKELTAEEVVQFLEPMLAKYKIPKIIEFMDEIPKTENNKINKKFLREFFNDKYSDRK
ncbi:MAG: acyl--CoA ligase [Lachnospiraceae bacterium]|nr:acyl--CoA ligase [Lachnospiraceae bacterium]